MVNCFLFLRYAVGMVRNELVLAIVDVKKNISRMVGQGLSVHARCLHISTARLETRYPIPCGCTEELRLNEPH